jgi:hypothetical protein
MMTPPRYTGELLGAPDGCLTGHGAQVNGTVGVNQHIQRCVR